MVTRRENETVDSLIRRFKSDVEQSGTLVELRKRMYYIPPSEKRRLKHEAAVKRQSIQERKARKFYGED